MRIALLVASLLAVAFAGCLEEGAGGNGPTPPAGSSAQFRLGGTYTENVTEAELAAAQAQVESRGGDLALLESFPMQFAVTGVGQADCEALRAWFSNQTFVQRVGECAAVTTSADPDEPVTDEPGEEPAGDQPITRTIHGRFFENATAENFTELDAQVRALGGSMALMKSYPAQYTISGLDQRTCDEARLLLMSKPYVATVGECQIVVTGEGGNDTLEG